MKFSLRSIDQQMKRFIAVFLMGVIVLTSTISVAALSHKVQINDGDKSLALVTINNKTDKILDQAGIQLEPNDVVERVDHDDDSIDIVIKRAFEVNVCTSSESKTLIFTEGTVKDAIELSDIELGEYDVVTPSLETELQPDLQIDILRKFKVKFTDAGEEITDVVVPEGTVENALKSLGIELSENDTVNLEMDKQVSENMFIKVDRIEYREISSTETVPFNVITTLSDELYEGEVQYTDGQDGENSVTNWEKVVNGQVIESKQIKCETTKEAVSAKKVVGIKSRQSSSSEPISRGYSRDNNDGTFVDYNGNTISYSSKLVGSATAYTANAGAITSTGSVVCKGTVAVNPNIIPYGTKLYIASPDGSFVYGYAIASDTGGALMSGSALVDLYYNTLTECYEFGRRTMCVYILS